MATSIILVPGLSSIGSVFYEPLKLELKSLGYTDITIVDLPSVDSVNRLSQLQPGPLEADIAHVRGIFESAIDAGKDVTIGAHSYGGTASLYATENLWKHERQAKGLSGGIVKALLLSSSLTLPGNSVAGERTEFSLQHGEKSSDEQPRVEIIDGMPVLYPETLGDVFFSDMTPAERTIWTERGLRPSPLGVVLSNVPQATVSSWRIAFLITTQDPAMTEAFQKYLIEKGRKAGAVIEEVKEIASGHFVQVTHAKETAAWIQGTIS